MMDNEINNAVMNDQRVTEARKELDRIVRNIQCGVKSDGNAGYYLAVMPPLLAALERAYTELATAEATAQMEAEKKRRKEREVLWNG